MTPNERDDDVPRLWRTQVDDLPDVTLDLVRIRSRTLERGVRLRNLGEHAAGLVVGLLLLPLVWAAPNAVVALGGVTLLVGLGYVTLRLRAFGAMRTMPSALVACSGVEFLRAELERQRDILQGVWRWYLLPFWPGMALIFVGTTLDRPDRWPVGLGSAVLAVLMACQIAWMNKRSAKSLQDLIDTLDEDPVAALRTNPSSPTLPHRLSMWLMSSFLGATAVLFGMRWFPDARSGVVDLVGLPADVPNAVLILVLSVAGVAAQAGWWILRRSRGQN